MEENPTFSILGSSCVCSNAVLRAICECAPHISALEHLDIYFLRPELRERFYRVVCSVVASAPPVYRQQ